MSEALIYTTSFDSAGIYIHIYFPVFEDVSDKQNVFEVMSTSTYFVVGFFTVEGYDQ